MILRLFAKRLKLLMTMDDDTNYNIAKLLGTTSGRVTNLRCAASHPKDSELQKLAEYYNVPIGFFTSESPMMVTQRINGTDYIMEYD